LNPEQLGKIQIYLGSLLHHFLMNSRPVLGLGNKIREASLWMHLRASNCRQASLRRVTGHWRTSSFKASHLRSVIPRASAACPWVILCDLTVFGEPSINEVAECGGGHDSGRTRQLLLRLNCDLVCLVLWRFILTDPRYSRVFSDGLGMKLYLVVKRPPQINYSNLVIDVKVSIWDRYLFSINYPKYEGSGKFKEGP
jgi:hypothetical protein